MKKKRKKKWGKRGVCKSCARVPREHQHDTRTSCPDIALILACQHVPPTCCSASHRFANTTHMPTCCKSFTFLPRATSIPSLELVYTSHPSCQPCTHLQPPSTTVVVVCCLLHLPITAYNRLHPPPAAT